MPAIKATKILKNKPRKTRRLAKRPTANKPPLSAKPQQPMEAPPPV